MPPPPPSPLPGCRFRPTKKRRSLPGAWPLSPRSRRPVSLPRHLSRTAARFGRRGARTGHSNKASPGSAPRPRGDPPPVPPRSGDPSSGPAPDPNHAARPGACGPLRDRLPFLLLVVEFLPDPRLAEQAPDRLRRLPPPVEPLERLPLVDQETGRVLLRVVGPDLLDVPPVPGRLGIRHHDAVRRQLLPARARQTNLHRHLLTSRIGLPNLRYHEHVSCCVS